jgi:alpha-glucosidase
MKVDDKYPRYTAGVAEKIFCTLPDGEMVTVPNWAGWAVFPDLTDPKAREWWGQQYATLFNVGFAGLWHDMTEPTAFTAWGDRTLPLPTRHVLEGRGGNHAEAHNIYALTASRAGYDAWQAARPNQRPWQLTRSGYAGIQRYAWSWTGDVESSWQGLRQTVSTALGLSLSGQPFMGADIGGFQGNASPELFTRWFQLGAFLPLFRTKANFANARRELWQYGEPTLTTVRNFLQLRQRLLPYWYTLAWEASQIGTPLIRPLFWLDNSEAFWEVDDAFLIGDALLAAPILEEGATAREVLLPGGQLWYSFWNDSLHTGGALRVKAPAPLERLPLYVRAGSVLPMEENDTLILHLYAPLEGAHTSMVFCDSGDGYGEAMVNYFQLHRSGSDLELFWERDGSLALPYTNVRVQVHGAQVAHAWGDDDSLVCANNIVTLTRPCHQLILASR